MSEGVCAQPGIACALNTTYSVAASIVVKLTVVLVRHFATCGKARFRAMTHRITNILEDILNSYRNLEWRWDLNPRPPRPYHRFRHRTGYVGNGVLFPAELRHINPCFQSASWIVRPSGQPVAVAAWFLSRLPGIPVPAFSAAAQDLTDHKHCSAFRNALPGALFS